MSWNPDCRYEHPLKEVIAVSLPPPPTSLYNAGMLNTEAATEIYGYLHVLLAQGHSKVLLTALLP